MLLSGLRSIIVLQVRAPEDIEARTVGHWKGFFSLPSFQDPQYSYDFDLYFICEIYKYEIKMVPYKRIGHHTDICSQ